MKKTLSTLLALILLLCLGTAAADQKVTLPDSRYSLTLPDGMEYDGPGEGSDDARFAYVSESLGLDIQFFRESDSKGKRHEVRRLRPPRRQSGPDGLLLVRESKGCGPL